MEDEMLIHRIVRAPEKRIFYVNVGNIAPAEVENFMQKTISKMKRTPYIDQQTGEYNLKYNMQNLLEDFYIPVRGNDQSTKIDTLQGLNYDGITDVIYLRDKLFAALKIPKAFLGYEKDLTGKATLAAEDIRFARTVERIQRIVLSELYKIALVHLYVQGYDGESLGNFELSLTTPSIIYDQEKIAIWKEKVTLAKDLLDTNLVPSDWIYDYVFKFSEDQYDELRDLVMEDKKRLFRLGQIENEGNDPAKSGKSYGTPHDLAALYGRGRTGMEAQQTVPGGYNEKAPIGRPKEKTSIINTQKDPLGKDRLGKKGMNTLYTANKPSNDMVDGTPKGGSPLALTELHKNKPLLESLRKNIIFKSDEPDLLSEENIKNI